MRRRDGFACAALACAAMVLAAAAGCRPESAPVPPAVPHRGTVAPAHDAPQPEAARLVCVRRGAPRPGGAAAVLWVDVAANDAERRHGLMGRASLDPDHGMLFAYPMPQRRTFWMKDTAIALDIAFVAADGRIARLATLPAGAGLADHLVATADSGGPVLWVVEADAGWFARHGVREGDRIDVAPAAAGVRPE